MITAHLPRPDDFECWRDIARAMVARGIAPGQLCWTEGEAATGDLFAGTPPAPHLPAPASPPPPGTPAPAVRASRAFLDLARAVLLHRDPSRLALLYRALWRLQSAPRLLDDAADGDVMALHRLARQVRRDIHKMRAFVRFRALPEDSGNGRGEEQGDGRFVAWFEPEHRIERHNARFFVDRFTNQRWSILTPRLSLHWDGETLEEGPPADRSQLPANDDAEELWLGYYRSIFNPARLKIGAMLKEMPRKYWKNMPEARQISGMVAGARQREIAMVDAGASLFDEPQPRSLAAVAEAIATCRRCAIGCNGTRAVAGEGPEQALLMIVGEQPGDTEEAAGRPFAGPAGQVLDAHLQRAAIDRRHAFVTNAVKHFKFAPRGKRRLHQNPTAAEIDTCRWWLDAERGLVRPRAILALGASAARGLLGRTPSIARERGTSIALEDGTRIWLTAHPSYLLRLDGPAREREEQRFAQDLAGLAQLLKDDLPRSR